MESPLKVGDYCSLPAEENPSVAHQGSRLRKCRAEIAQPSSGRRHTVASIMEEIAIKGEGERETSRDPEAVQEAKYEEHTACHSERPNIWRRRRLSQQM